MSLPAESSPARAPTVVGRRTLVSGSKYSYEELTIRTAAGATRARQVVAHPGAVVVVPILADGRLVFIRNFRVAVEHAGAWVLEFCAGTLDVPGENPADCAKRELIEETGYRAETITPLLHGDAGSPGYFYTTPGLTSERMFPFAATGLTHVGQELQEDEAIELVTLTPAEAWAAADGGGAGERASRTLMDAKSIVALVLATRRGLVRI